MADISAVVTRSKAEDSTIQQLRPWRAGVSGRLLAAFCAIALFAVLAAAAAIHGFGLVGARIAVVGSRVPTTLAALELSRSAERIIAAAPALLAASDPAGHEAVAARLGDEGRRIEERLRDLGSASGRALPLDEIAATATALRDTLGEIHAVVAHRLSTAEQLTALRRDLFDVGAEVQRLLAPWLTVLDHEVAAAGAAERVPALTALRQVQAAQRQASALLDLLAEASTTEEADRLPILQFQAGLALSRLEDAALDLDDRLRPLFLDQVERLHALTRGGRSIAAVRKEELGLTAEGETQLAAATALSAKLTAAVDRLGAAAKGDVARSVEEAAAVQRLSTRVLVALVALSLASSALIVWLYVRGNVVRRLTALSQGMLAIAGGSLSRPVAVHGNDEIAAMARAVEVFRCNAIELRKLLDERRTEAERLERTVTERTRELEDKSRRLEIADRFKSNFLASASHDLRQPLYALNLFVGELRAAAAPDRDRLVERIGACVEAMNALFASLLDMAQLEAGMIEPAPLAFPVLRSLGHVEATLADAARGKGLRLRVVPSSASVHSDPVLLERILMNLVGNAVRYTERGGIVVGCRRRAGSLRIDVCDTGPGIPPEQQDRIFEEYHRLDQHRGGFGLGLAIVDRLAHLLEHRVELESRPGRGTRFSVTLPLAAAPAAEPEQGPPPFDTVRDRLVVVIDDDILVLEGLGGLLRRWGCAVVAGPSAAAALHALAAAGRPPDLIVSDYALAGTSGIEAIARLRAAWGESVPAFLISGDTAPDRLRHARESGLHLLHKPVSPMRLRAMLARMLRPAPTAMDGRSS